MSKTTEQKSGWIFPVLFLTMTIGFIAMSITSSRYANELAELKAANAVVVKTPVVVEPAEDAARLLRDRHIENCKLDRSVEFFRVEDGKIVPRGITGPDRLACIEEAFAMNGSPTDKLIMDASRAASTARRDLFRQAFDYCRLSSAADENKSLMELKCVDFAYKKTIEVIR